MVESLRTALQRIEAIEREPAYAYHLIPGSGPTFRNTRRRRVAAR